MRLIQWVGAFSVLVTVSFQMITLAAGKNGVPQRVIEALRHDRPEEIGFRDAKGRWIPLTSSMGVLTGPAADWALQDSASEGVEGTSTELAYRSLSLKEPAAPIVVAVIDGGVDVNHEDLQGVLWVNEKERNGVPGRDNDGNGYIGDVYGWNFLGGKNGKNVKLASLEVTRELSRLLKKESSVGLSEAEKAYRAKLQPEYDAQYLPRKRDYGKARAALEEMEFALAVLRNVGLREETRAAVEAIQSEDEEVLKAKGFVLQYLVKGVTSRKLQMFVERARLLLDTYFNFDFDFSAVIGDDPKRLDDLGYGNADVIAEGADHGTHVAGIIAATRDNDRGMNGQAKFARIMSLRAVPDGDERDKDVANAIRYAADNGAKIINMSFGKILSPDQDYVAEAIRYAEGKGVLLVHAAGNDGEDNDVIPHFPRRPAQGSPWLEVGASDYLRGTGLVADFSNYGAATVDLFAPGVRIFSTLPGNQYGKMSGTSMATPEAAGVAALVWSQAPELSARELRELLLRTAVRYPGLEVARPSSGMLIPFSTLSATGGVINAFSALRALGLPARQ